MQCPEMPEEIRQASQKLGLQTDKNFQKESFPLMEAFEKAVQKREANSHYCIVFGSLCLFNENSFVRSIC
jgi:urease accessory protein